MRAEVWRRIGAWRELSTLALLAVVVLAASAKDPGFLRASSLNSVLLWIPLIAVVAMGQMLVIVTRGIDISVGSMVGLSGMAAGMLFRDNPDLGLGLGTLAGVGVGLLLGSLNGALIAYAGVPPIIATLGTLSAYRGGAFILSGGRQIDSNHLPEGLTRWSLDGPFRIGQVNVPWILVMTAAVAAVAAWTVRKTRFGRDVYALGSNPEAARLRGVPVPRTTFWVYALTGALSGLAGVMYASRYGFVNPATAGYGLELIVIAAVVVGGVKVSGGSGGVVGVLLGCLLLATINVALAVLGIAARWQLLIYGVVIVLALAMDARLTQRMTRWREVRR